MLKTFQLRMRALRRGVGLSLQQVAERSGTSYQTLQAWETQKGHRRKDPKIKAAVVKALADDINEKFPEKDRKINPDTLEIWLDKGVGEIPLSREDLEEYTSASKGGEQKLPQMDFSAEDKNQNRTFLDNEKVKDKLIRTLEENNQLLRDRLHDLEARLAALERKG
ncbi:MAG: helix-turn-helix transcriptional regulator [Nitrospinae bacterium]|nr:helix-turn-helix transcriptional regulator [Nitrospinota bacterium]